jgi:O-antigen ligase/tetratricopeptide (TPR) repeat protein
MFVVVALLIPFSALALGAVHPWAYKVIEEASFVAAAVWMVQVAAGRCSAALPDRHMRRVLVPAALFLGIVAFQLLPLPPVIEQAIFPGTYRLYCNSLPGWPQRTPYQWLQSPPSVKAAERYLLPTQSEVRNGLPVPFAPHSATPMAQEIGKTAAKPHQPLWMPLSVAPGLTRIALLKALACFTIGLIVLLCPLPRDGLARELRPLMWTILVTGFAIALIGLVQQLAATSRPMGIFSPYDWHGYQPWGARAFGPFANPDHYANYLAMVLPLALAAVLFPELLGKVRDRGAVALIGAAVTLTMLAALIATGSRGGWSAAAVGTLVFLLMAVRLPRDRRPVLLQHGRYRGLVLTVAAAATVTAALYLTAADYRVNAGQRVQEAFTRADLAARVKPARDSLDMIADFPLLGLGSGAWPDIFRRYSSPPWSPDFWPAAHDEYVQLAVETGVVGFLLALAAVGALVSLIRSGLSSLPMRRFPMVAAFCAGLSAMAVQAMFDFPLRIPANALLATVMAAALLRAICGGERAGPTAASPHVWAGGCALLAVGLMWTAWHQPAVPYPYNLSVSEDRGALRAQLMQHPANSRVHLALLAALGESMPVEQGVRELRSAPYLEPANPIARDLYAHTLFAQGKADEAAAEITRSVLNSPSLGTHYYLSVRLIPWLTPAEQSAVVAGLQRAIASGYPDSNQALANLYRVLGRFGQQAGVLERAARSEPDRHVRCDLLTQAAVAYARAGEHRDAARSFDEAIAAQPTNPDPYRYMAQALLAPAKEFDQAREVLSQGMARGADRLTLLIAAAAIEREAGKLEAAEAPLKEAARLQPYNFEVALELGELYLTEGKFDQSTAWLKKATSIDPQSAPAFFELAQAEDNGYQYYTAGRDYARAAELAPGNQSYSAKYAEFRRRVAMYSSP